MNCVEVVRHKQRLDYLFQQIRALPVDAELQAHWARYLCVLASGFIETSVRAIFTQYARTKSGHPHITNFIEGQIKGFQNPKMEKILELSRMFNPEWEDDLRAATEDELKDAVDSIVANKNAIAHGESVGVTFTRVQRYYSGAVKVIELLENQCQ